MVLYQGKRKYLKSIDQWTKPKRKSKRKNDIKVGKLNTISKPQSFEQMIKTAKVKKPMSKKQATSFMNQINKAKVGKRTKLRM